MILGVPKFDIESMNHILASLADTFNSVEGCCLADRYHTVSNNIKLVNIDPTNLRFAAVLGMKLMAPVKKKHATQHSLSVFPGRLFRQEVDLSSTNISGSLEVFRAPTKLGW